jgi:hypothetical protein
MPADALTAPTPAPAGPTARSRARAWLDRLLSEGEASAGQAEGGDAAGRRASARPAAQEEAR